MSGERFVKMGWVAGAGWHRAQDGGARRGLPGACW